MHAVFVKVDVSEPGRERALEHLRQNVVPQVKQAPGFHSGTWLAPDADDKGMGVVVFESEDAAEGAAERMRSGELPGEIGVKVESVEIREVAATA